MDKNAYIDSEAERLVMDLYLLKIIKTEDMATTKEIVKIYLEATHFEGMKIIIRNTQ